MEKQDATNKTAIVIETGATVYGDAPANISDNVIIATLAAVAFVLFVAIGIVMWRCFISSNNSGLQEHGSTNSYQQLYSSHRTPLDKSELTRLLRKYSSVGEAGNMDPGIPPSPDWFTDESENMSFTDTETKVALPSSSILSYSPWSSTPERLRKSSGSSIGIPHRLSSSDYKNVSHLAERSPRTHSESLLLDDAVFTSPMGQYHNKRLWMITNLSEHYTPSPTWSPVEQSEAATSRSQSIPEQKRFYFAWPEEEEEDNVTVWSPLLLKLAAVEMSKNETSSSVTGSLDGRIRSGSCGIASSKVDVDDKGVVQSRYSVDILPGVKNTWV